MASTSSLKSNRKTIEELVEKSEIWHSLTQSAESMRRLPSNGILYFKHYKTKEYQVLLQDDPSMELNKGIYKNISKFGLHRATSKTLVLPCLDVIDWMTRRIDHESRTILNFKDKHVASYQAPVLNLLYHFKEAQVKVTPEWLKNKTESVYFLSIMKDGGPKDNLEKILHL